MTVLRFLFTFTLFLPAAALAALGARAPLSLHLVCVRADCAGGSDTRCEWPPGATLRLNGNQITTPVAAPGASCAAQCTPHVAW